MAETSSALSIGAILGSGLPESQTWQNEIRSLMRAVKTAREGVDSPLEVNVVFHVPGRHDPNEFEGVRTGSFSKRDALLMVQAAVPPGPLADDPKAVLRELLLGAIAAAELFAKQGSIASGLPATRRIALRATSD